jgi:hypothetical protein
MMSGHVRDALADFDRLPAIRDGRARVVCGSSIIALLLLFWNLSELLSIVLSIAVAAVIYVTILLVLRGVTIQEIKFMYRIYKRS